MSVILKSLRAKQEKLRMFHTGRCGGVVDMRTPLVALLLLSSLLAAPRRPARRPHRLHPRSLGHTAKVGRKLTNTRTPLIKSLFNILTDPLVSLQCRRFVFAPACRGIMSKRARPPVLSLGRGLLPRPPVPALLPRPPGPNIFLPPPVPLRDTQRQVDFAADVVDLAENRMAPGKDRAEEGTGDQPLMTVTLRKVRLNKNQTNTYSIPDNPCRRTDV